jgi:hypothetical protein
VTPNGDVLHPYLPLTARPTGDLARAVGFDIEDDGRTAFVMVESNDPATGATMTNKYQIEVDERTSSLIRDAVYKDADHLNYVEGLGARHFSEDAIDFWKLISAFSLSPKNNRDGTPGVNLNNIYGNTFGTMGEVAFVGSAAKLVTSFARSLPVDETAEPFEKGIFAAPGATFVSGGSAISNNSLGKFSESFGLSPQQAQGMKNVADALPNLVDRSVEKYNLSEVSRVAWQNAIFASPDIPSVILPGTLVSEITSRDGSQFPGQTLADLQTEIDDVLKGLIDTNDLGEIITLHHTPSNPGDTVKLHDASKPDDSFTTEYQFAVNSQKALGVFEHLSQNYLSNTGVDLRVEMEDRGYPYSEIRKLSLNDTIKLFGEVVRPIILQNGANSAGKVVVAGDTYYEKGSATGGSDRSMIDACRALYGSDNTLIVQVDTFGGKTPDEPGRNPFFGMSIDPETNKLRLEYPDSSKERAVDPSGPNADGAPNAFFRRQEEFSTVFFNALNAQSPFAAEELDQFINRAA